MDRPLRVLVATPYGQGGQGGIDRLNDAIFSMLQHRSSLRLERLVTRGKRGLLAAQFIFLEALILFALAALLKKVDLLHIHLSDHGSSYRKSVLGALARLLGVPYVVHLHGVNFRESWLPARTRLARKIDNLLLGSRSILVLGQVWSALITERLPETANKIIVLPNATRKFTRRLKRPREASVQISFLGRLGARKGSTVLIEALSIVAGLESWKATLAGDGEVDEGEKQAEKLGLADRISFPGWLNASETDQLLERTDILVLPSFAENLPMVILEAFAAGITVVSTPVGAIPEVIKDGQNGLLVAPGDPTTLAQALERLIADPALRRRLGQAARLDHARRYEISGYIAALADIWKNAAGLTPASRSCLTPNQC